MPYQKQAQKVCPPGLNIFLNNGSTSITVSLLATCLIADHDVSDQFYLIRLQYLFSVDGASSVCAKLG